MIFTESSEATTGENAKIALRLQPCRTCGVLFGHHDGRCHFCSEACRLSRRLRNRAARLARSRARHPDREMCRQTL